MRALRGEGTSPSLTGFSLGLAKVAKHVTNENIDQSTGEADKNRVPEEKTEKKKEVLGGGLEPPCLTAYAPQTYVSAISPPEQLG